MSVKPPNRNKLRTPLKVYIIWNMWYMINMPGNMVRLPCLYVMSYIPYFCRYTFPCKAWIDIHKKVKQEYAKVLEVRDVQESKLTTVRSKQLMSTDINLSFIFTDVSFYIIEASIYSSWKWNIILFFVCLLWQLNWPTLVFLYFCVVF